MSVYGDRAYEAFFKGYNCSQCVALAFAKEMGLTEEQALKMASGFGGGFGRMREVCGAFSGITLVLGALYGNTDPAKKTQTYTEIQALAEQYKQRNGGGSIVCHYKKRPCPELVRLAADIMAEYIETHPLENA